jgi:hypothetical protein
MSEERIIFGAPVAHVPGSKQYACALCQQMVWLAPSGQRIVREGAAVWCMECTFKNSDTISSVELTPEAPQEYIAGLLWKDRN